MPLDERWDPVSDDDWSAFAHAWIEQLRHDQREGDRDWDETVTMMGFTARPEQQWKFVLAAVDHAHADDELGHIAAGPIEHLLGWHGEKYIAEIEARASSDPKFARTITGVWRHRTSDEIWRRVQAIQSQATPLQYSEEA